MKKLLYCLLALLVITSCQKNDLPGDNGCISRITGHYYAIKTSDSLAAITELNKNGIAHSDLTLSFVGLDTVPAGPNVGTYQNVFAVQNINGLPVLSGDLWYQFKNNTLQSLTGTRYGTISLSNNPVLSLSQLRQLYLTATAKNNSTVANLKDSCLVARFGYYDLNASVSQTPNFVKAWVVKPQNADYPQVIFQDVSGNMIIYNGGVMPD